MKLKIDEFIAEIYLEEKAKNTLTKYKSDIYKFIDFVGNDESEITKEQSIAYKAFLCNGQYKTSSINSYIIAINKYFKWIGTPELKVKIIKQQRKNSLEDVISITDYKRLLRNAKRLGMFDIYYLMKILASTGIRIDETKYITVESLNENYIKVNNKGKEREISIPKELVRELKKYCTANKIKTGYVFCSSRPGNLIQKSTAWRKMKKIAGVARVNKNKVHAHSFRHLFAKEYMAKYNNAIELADILGHSSLETTRIYTRSTSYEKRQKIESLKL
jgi:site-specific recombinase XerD